MITIIIIIPFEAYSLQPIPASSQLSACLALCLVILKGATDGELRYVFLQPLDIFSPGTITTF
jgi:hypothetical protein